MIKIITLILISFYLINNCFAKQPDFLVHSHPHKNIEQLVQSKTKSDMSYKELMEKFGTAYSMIQEGLIREDKIFIEMGLDTIQNHPTTKNNPWEIVKAKDTEAFKATLLYFDEQLHKSTLDITNSLKTNNWIEINKKIFNLSNNCINCHIIWKDNLDK